MTKEKRTNLTNERKISKPRKPAERIDKPINMSIRFSPDEYTHLINVINFFQEKTVSEVTKTDTIKFLLENIDRIIQENNEDTEKFFDILGIKYDFKVGRVQ